MSLAMPRLSRRSFLYAAARRPSAGRVEETTAREPWHRQTHFVLLDIFVVMAEIFADSIANPDSVRN